MLKIKNIKKSFGPLQVLKGVDLEVSKGDVVAILGPSGSGKTTLLRCINFLETADSGLMTFGSDTYDLAKISKRDIAAIRKRTAFVFQNYNLFRNKTALQNVTAHSWCPAYRCRLSKLTMRRRACSGAGARR